MIFKHVHVCDFVWMVFLFWNKSLTKKPSALSLTLVLSTAKNLEENLLVRKQASTESDLSFWPPCKGSKTVNIRQSQNTCDQYCTTNTRYCWPCQWFETLEQKILKPIIRYETCVFKKVKISLVIFFTIFTLAITDNVNQNSH